MAGQAPDPVAANLEAVKERAEALTASHADEDCEGTSEPCTGHDALRLVAAIEALLDLHKPAGFCMDVHPCERHRDLGGKTFVQMRAERKACPDCTFTERVTCWQSKCREETWPCTEYRAISAALLGEEKTGG